MSITTELQRISQAKADLKTSIISKEVEVAETETIDTYASKVDAVYTKGYEKGKAEGGNVLAVKGYFTPEKDTQVFSVSGLPFAPETISINCPETYSNTVRTAILHYAHAKPTNGIVYARGTGTTATYYTLSLGSGLTTWSDDGVSVDVSKSSTDMGDSFFKAGYTYIYYISGGFEK